MTPEEAAATADPVAFATFVSRGRWKTAPHLEFVAVDFTRYSGTWDTHEAAWFIAAKELERRWK